MFATGLKWLMRGIFLIVFGFGLVACTQLGLNYASLETNNKPVAWPPLTPDDLTTGRDTLISNLEDHVFGPFPVGIESRLISRRTVDDDYANGAGRLDELLIELGPEGAANAVRFHLGLALPKTIEGPAPLIINQSFSNNRRAFASNALTPLRFNADGEPNDDEAKGVVFTLATSIFGRYIATPPNEDILRRGYAIASFHGSEIIPDSVEAGAAALATFPAGNRGKPTGAVSAWAAGYSAAISALSDDVEIDGKKIAVMGHSRHGKSALISGVIDDRVSVVLSHQSGTGGAAISRDKPGETVGNITGADPIFMSGGYPHWFDPAYSEFDKEGPQTTPTDMHILIALNAPKKVLLGNGRRDVWSDPNGSFRAAQAASLAWSIEGKSGLTTRSMTEIDHSAGIVYHMRAGGHGIVPKDWDVFFATLDAAWK